jgi:hypothetical protein
VEAALRRAASEPEKLWRRITASRRSWPDFVILGAQRAGTTSLYDWITDHDEVTPAWRKEVHYFDRNYGRGQSWYLSHFPVRRSGLVTGEASPYLLFHPLAPARAAADLPATTRFIVLLRDPVQRAVSHYWHERRMKAEPLPLDAALDQEHERLAGQMERVQAGERSFAHFHYSYVARGLYGEQLERWFAVVGRERVLVVESEKVFVDADVRAGVEGWLGLPVTGRPFPAMNEAPRREPVSPAATALLESSFAAPNEELFALLGQRLWDR